MFRCLRTLREYFEAGGETAAVAKDGRRAAHRAAAIAQESSSSATDRAAAVVATATAASPTATVTVTNAPATAPSPTAAVTVMDAPVTEAGGGPTMATVGAPVTATTAVSVTTAASPTTVTRAVETIASVPASKRAKREATASRHVGEPTPGSDSVPVATPATANLHPATSAAVTTAATRGPLAVLDVGSCYNALGRVPGLNVTAVDLAPAVPEVLRGDFLQTRFTNESSAPLAAVVEHDDQDAATASPGAVVLRSGAFDAVVFNLLLSYLPTPALRFR